MKHFLGALLAALLILPISQALAEPAHIFILRHAEKNNDEELNLSEKGYRRAAALAKFFTQSKFTDMYGTPEALFAAKARPGKSKRSVETLQPTAQAFGIRLNSTYEKGDEKELMKDILDDPSLDGKTVIICWNHSGIPKFLKRLDIDAEWDDSSFDRLWILSKKGNGDYKFRDAPQRVLPGDSAK